MKILQEEVENRSVTLVINCTKLTARELRSAMGKYLAHRKNKKYGRARGQPVKPKGKQTVKQLVGQDAGVSNIEVKDASIRSFDRIARKYGVDYAVRKDRGSTPPKYLVFFKSRDADALTAAFSEYSAMRIRRKQKPSVLEKLQHFKEQVKHAVHDRNRRREMER